MKEREKCCLTAKLLVGLQNAYDCFCYLVAIKSAKLLVFNQTIFLSLQANKHLAIIIIIKYKNGCKA